MGCCKLGYRRAERPEAHTLNQPQVFWLEPKWAIVGATQ
jgi:hypothetical protein